MNRILFEARKIEKYTNIIYIIEPIYYGSKRDSEVQVQVLVLVLILVIVRVRVSFIA